MKPLYSIIKKISLGLLLFFWAVNGVEAQQKYVCHGLLNSESEVNHGIVAMNRMVNAGCNATMLTVLWERVYPQPNSKPNWAQLDNQINYAVNQLGIKVAIRIHLGRKYSTTKGFWEEEEAVKDFKGKVLTDYYDNNHFSFAHQASVEKAKGFVQEVCERYKSYQQKGKILFISVVNTPQQELGFTYQNQQWPEKSYVTLFDHSKWAMIKFKDWAKEKYTTITTLNAYWGTNYRSFLEVEPYVNWWSVQDSFRGRRGKDWYIFRHLMIKNYYDQIIDGIKSIDPSYKIACEFGGIADDLTINRNTFAFKDLIAKADILKTSSDGFQGDIAYSNTASNKKFYTEIAFFDLPTAEDIKNYTKRAVDYNLEFIMFLVESDSQAEFDKLLPAVQEAVKGINKKSNIAFSDSIKYRLSQLTDSRELVINDWKTRSENGKKRVKITLEEDLLLENKKITNPLPDNQSGTGFPPISGGPNLLPKENILNYTKEIVVNQNFQFRLPENLYYDPDGFIAFIEVLETPSWISFNKFELNFSGKAPHLGKFKVKVRVYDNNGASIESYVNIDVVSPIVNFELIKASYFYQTTLEPWGFIENNRVLYLDALPEKMNILARCNLDSVKFVFDLTGPYKFKGNSELLPYNVFGEGRGIGFPVGTYQLTAKAYNKKDSVLSSKTVKFFVKSSTNNISMTDWINYPNPFENICNIKLPETEEAEKLSFAFYTVLGQRQAIKKEYISIVEKTAYLDFSNFYLPTGTYILEISKDGQVIKTIRIAKM